MKSFVFFFSLLVLGRTATALETATEPQKLTGTAVIAQNYSAGYEWRQDASGTLYGPYVGLDFKQKLFQNYTAEVNARLFKGASSDDLAMLGLEVAQLSYVGSWFTLSGGRRDLGSFLSPGTYFGAYTTMGERQLDAASLTFPFRLFADIPDADTQVRAPYNALSLLVAPNLFEAAKSTYNGDQGLIVVQLRVKFRVMQSSSDLYLNYARGLNDYFENSSVDTAGTVDLSYAFKLGIWGWYVNYAEQNLKAQGTSVLAAGSSLDARKLTFGLFDSILYEAQIPLSTDPGNPFTGGNSQDPTQGAVPQWSWFVKVSNKLGSQKPTDPMRLFYGGAVTNSVGDYTFARLAEGTITVPVAPGYGVGPRVEGLTLRSPDYNTYSVILYAGYEF